jgi:hypothetical protein
MAGLATSRMNALQRPCSEALALCSLQDVQSHRDGSDVVAMRPHHSTLMISGKNGPNSAHQTIRAGIAPASPPGSPTTAASHG